MDKIIQFITDNDWQAAAEAVLHKLETEKFNDELAILAATVNDYFGDDEMVFSFINQGLAYNYKNYELYLMLGNYYAKRNMNQAYLCYENALYYCEMSGNTEDYEELEQVKRNFTQEGIVNVNPYSIVIISHNTLEQTKICIDSIRQNCCKDTYEIIVVDNASVDGSREWLQQEDIVLFVNAEELPIPVCYNQGMRCAAENNDIMLLDSSVVMMPNTMFTLRMGLYDSEKNGSAGCVANCSNNNQEVEEKHESIEDYKKYSVKNNIISENVYEYKSWLNSAALLIKRSMLIRLGELDEQFMLTDFSDNDLGLCILNMGYRNVLCWNSFVFCGDTSCYLKSDAQQRVTLMQRDRARFQEKWEMGPYYYSNVRKDLIAFIRHEQSEHIRVLEIGCGIGATLGKIKYKYPNSEVYGVEIVDKVAKLGASNFEIICENIEDNSLPFEERYFDYIIFGDVLEHLREPETVLLNIKRYLKPGGSIIASIPNIMNAETIYQLLHGFFTYEQAGIRDRTHLRFFTLYEIVNMMERVGYQIKEIDMSRAQGLTTRDFSEFFDKLLAIEGVAERKYFDALQYLFRAEVI